MFHQENAEYFLLNIADKTGLKEKAEGIRRILYCLYSFKPASTKEVCINTRISLPLVAAVRKEFENSGILQRASGLTLTDKGNKIAHQLFKYSNNNAVNNILSSADFLTSSRAEQIKRELSNIMKERPGPDRTIDQSHSTVETQLKRSMHMFLYDALAGRHIAILGDDDLTSLSICIFLRYFLGLKDYSTLPCRIKVFEIDDRIVNFINNSAKNFHYPVKAIKTDLRDKIVPPYMDIFDAIFTDPPYTVSGVTLFLSRSLEMLSLGVGKRIFLSMPPMKRNDMLQIQKNIANMDLLTESIHQRFNKYHGNSIYGNHSDLYTLSICELSRPIIKDDINDSHEFGKIYTFDNKPKIRHYRCTGCNKIFIAGEGGITIDKLKAEGCAVCGSNNFDRITGNNGTQKER